jgi:hypothetical protein
MAKSLWLVASLALAACGESPSDGDWKASTGAPVQRIEIPLDDAAGGTASVARNFYFILDGSGSMKDRCSGDKAFAHKIDGAKWAVSEFLKHVPDDANLGLWVFDGNGPGERVALAPGNRAAFSAAVDAIEASGGTPLAEAIHAAVGKLVLQYKRQLGYGEYRLVIVTDGIADGIPDAAAVAAAYGFPIYTIGFCIDEEHPLRHVSVSYRAADSAADLQAGLEAAVAEIETFDATSFAR